MSGRPVHVQALRSRGLSLALYRSAPMVRALAAMPASPMASNASAIWVTPSASDRAGPEQRVKVGLGEPRPEAGRLARGATHDRVDPHGGVTDGRHRVPSSRTKGQAIGVSPLVDGATHILPGECRIQRRQALG